MAQLVERSLLIPEVCDLNPVIGKNVLALSDNCIERMKINEKEAGNGPIFLKKLSSSNSCCYKNNFLNLKQSHKKVSPPTKRNKTYRVIQNNAQIVFEKECSSRWRRKVSQTLRRNYLLTTEASNCCQLRVHQKQLQPTPRQPNEKQCKQNKFRSKCHFKLFRVGHRCITSDHKVIYCYCVPWNMGGSSGLLVMGGDPCSVDYGFESQHRILDGHFFT